MMTSLKPQATRSYSSLSIFCRSLLFSIFSLLSIIGYGAYFTAVAWAFPVAKRHEMIRGYLRFYFSVLKRLCHIDSRIIGIENIPQDRAGVIMSKHQSTWETFMLPIIFENPAIILKRQLLFIPFFGWGLALAKPIGINRSNRSSAMHQLITQGTECLNAGRSILIFPEGTRIPYGKVGHYRLGGARLAVATGYPIIPVAHDAGYFWPRRKFLKRPGTITLVIGPPIETKGLTPEEALEKTKHWIEATITNLQSDAS